MRIRLFHVTMALAAAWVGAQAWAQTPPAGAAAAPARWATAWAASVQGPYPIGNPSAQPDLRFAFASTDSGARDQSFRLMVLPDIWGPQARIRVSNALGTQPVVFDGVYLGLQAGSSALVRGSNRPVSFSGRASVTVPAG